MKILWVNYHIFNTFLLLLGTLQLGMSLFLITDDNLFIDLVREFREFSHVPIWIVQRLLLGIWVILLERLPFALGVSAPVGFSGGLLPNLWHCFLLGVLVHFLDLLQLLVFVLVGVLFKLIVMVAAVFFLTFFLELFHVMVLLFRLSYQYFSVFWFFGEIQMRWASCFDLLFDLTYEVF